MAQDDELDLDVGTANKSGGGSKMIIIAVLAIVLMGGTVGLTMMLMGGDKKVQVDEDSEEESDEEDEEEEKPKKKKKKKRKKKKGSKGKSKLKTPFYLELPKPVVVNLDGSSGVRFLQVSVALMVYKESDVELLKKHLPVIRHNLVLLFSSQNFSDLQSMEGKKKLQANALKAVREELTKLIGKPIVEAVYLPSIVGQ